MSKEEITLNFLPITLTNITIGIQQGAALQEGFEEEFEEDFEEGFEEDFEEDFEEGFQEGAKSRRRRRRNRNRKRNKNNNKNVKDGTKYYYVTAKFFNHNHPANLYISSNNIYYTTEELYIVGSLDSPEDKSKATLIFYLKSASDYGDRKPSHVYMCFRLQSSNVNSKTNVDEVVNIIKKDINALDFNTTLSQFGNLTFSKMTKVNQTTETYVYIFNQVFDVHNLETVLDKLGNNKGKAKWLTVKKQKDGQRNRTMGSSKPFDLEILVPDANKPLNDKTVKAVIDRNMTNEEKIYIKCAPAGASKETVPMKLVSSSKKNDSSQLQIYTTLFASVMIVMIIVWSNQKIIYNLLTNDFKKIIGIDGSQDPPYPLIMFAFFLIDMIPWISGILLNSLGNSNLMRDYQKNGHFFVQEDKKDTIKLAVRMLFMFLYVGIIYELSNSVKKANWLVILVFLVLLFSQMLFFTVMWRTTRVEIERLKR